MLTDSEIRTILGKGETVILKARKFFNLQEYEDFVASEAVETPPNNTDNNPPNNSLPLNNVPVQVKNVPPSTDSIEALPPNSRLYLFGYSIMENAAASEDGSNRATVSIRNGVNGMRLAMITLTENQSTSEFFGDVGIPAPNGLYVSRTSGSTSLIIYYKEY